MTSFFQTMATIIPVLMVAGLLNSQFLQPKTPLTHYPFDMTEKTFFLHIDAYKYELPYWMFPWIAKTTADAKQADMLVNLRAPNLSDPSTMLDLWIKPESQINFAFIDRLDPEIPERLTSYQRHQLMGITNTYERHGYWLLDLNSDDGEPSFIEWDDPDYRERPSTKR